MTDRPAIPDPATEAGQRVLGRLADEMVVWLTTATPDGRLQSSAVWFLWAAGEFLLFSRAGAPRARNIAANANVSVHLNSDRLGDDIVTFEGLARLEPGTGPASANPAYVAKYGELIRRNGWTPETFSGDYPDPILIRPTRLRLG